MRDDDDPKSRVPDAGELEALELLDQRHPWELTVDELVARMRSDHGLLIEVHTDPYGVYLKKGDRICPLPNIERHEVLHLDVLERVVDSLGLSRVDLQLSLPGDRD